MNHAAEPVYKRDQVERAIAALTGRVSDANHRPDADLKADLKRLLDVDRAHGSPTPKGPRSRYAFFDAAPPGKGVDLAYRFGAAFALFVGERLMRAGLTQNRAVMRIRLARPALDRKAREILSAFPNETFHRPSRRGPLRYKPRLEEMKFWVTHGDPGADLGEPERFCSAKDLPSALAKATAHCEPAMTIELVEAVLGLQHWLQQIPARKRGRS
ncbi:MAG: hypothetical protein K2Y05_11840 [Hyphomicrobiaceae bacterium]|nr:hypothetical protein [Hyphomicrobiaceae bacterium]